MDRNMKGFGKEERSMDKGDLLAKMESARKAFERMANTLVHLAPTNLH